MMFYIVSCKLFSYILLPILLAVVTKLVYRIAEHSVQLYYSPQGFSLKMHYYQPLGVDTAHAQDRYQAEWQSQVFYYTANFR
jgi:hypothetical protein